MSYTRTLHVCAALIGVVCLMLSFAGMAYGDMILVEYDFTKGVVSSFERSATQTADNVTVGNMQAFLNGSLSTVTSQGVSFSPSNHTASMDSSKTPATITPTTGTYFTYKVAPDPGYWLDLESMQFTWYATVGTMSTAETWEYELRSSVDGFTTVLGSDSTSDTTGWLRPQDIDLSGLGAQSSEVEFRIYFADTRNTSGNVQRLGPRDAGLLTLYGTAVPEPSSIVLLLCAAVGLLGFRWRRNAQS